MALLHDGAAPYAPASAIQRFIERARQVGPPQRPVNREWLLSLGIQESLAPRTLQALRLLELTQEDGLPSDHLRTLARATEADFRRELGDLLERVYAPVFEIVDPRTATSVQLEDAFRGFVPAGQRSRMVGLFTGLLTYAGMIDSPPNHARPSQARAKPKDRRRRTSREEPPVDRKQEEPDLASSQDSELQHNARRATPHPSNTSQHRTVALRSGGSVTLSLDCNLLDLDEADTEYVLALQRALRSYEQVPSSGV